ncbi:MAG: hypothetical protein Q4B43_10900 [Bacteroidota bacterium]|nr:hypothetical protein [Bacteroidota bacterium]
MDILLKNNNISKKQYDDYFSKSSYSEDILKTALIIGGLVLLGYLISQKVE